MLKNTIKIALRNIIHQKTYSLLNIIGLALGISVFLFISLYVARELTFDAFHKDSHTIFRIVTEHDNGTDRYAKCPEPIADVCSPAHITAITRLGAIFGIVVKANNDLFLERNAAYADAAFFDIFTIPFIKGNKRGALNTPDQILLSRATAIKYFGDTDVLGESIRIEDKGWTITGVFEDIPSNSHLPELTMLLPYSAKIPPQNPWDEWVPTYVKVAKKNLAGEVNAWLDERVRTFRPSAIDYPYTHQLQPVRDIHLGDHYIAEYAKSGDAKQLFVFASIAILILLVACLNFVNLSAAQFTGRWKEIGIRKVIGAFRSHLLKQLLGELSILILLALFVAFFIVEVSHPWFNQLMGVDVKPSLSDPFLWAIFLFIILFIYLIAGMYPSLRLAAFQPVQILRNQQLSGAGRKLNARSVLVVCQFIVSIALIVCSVVILKQMNFLNTKELGFKADRLLVIPTQTQKMAQQLKTDFETIKQKFSQHHNVKSVTTHLSSPGRAWRMEWPTVVESNFTPPFPFTYEFVDFDFIKTYKLTLLYGREFNKDFSADFGNTIIINEAAVRSCGFLSPEEAISKHISTWLGSAEIVGILKDFHYQSLHQKIDPLMLSVMPGFFPETTTLQLGSAGLAETLAFLERQWAEIFPDFPFEYYFVDKDFAANYDADNKFAQAIYLFSTLAIIIACLGLLGLASFAAIKRTKEIGIRKVLGATAAGMTVMLCAEFTKWILLANIFAWPIAWIAARTWLNNFAYHIDINLWLFCLAGIMALGIALLTVSLQVIKAATGNPVEALRYE